MKQLHIVSGLPRSGSTLLCQILNMNPDFAATQTSPMIDMLTSQQAVFSHNPAYKTLDRKVEYEAFAEAQRAFIESYYSSRYEASTIFDKNRAWAAHLFKLDDIFDNSETKIIWTYRNPIDVVKSMESKHREMPLIQYVDEQGGVSMATLEQRISNWTGDNGIIALPVYALSDAINMGYEDRIHIVDYEQLCKDPQFVMNGIHKFLELESYQYDAKNFKDLKQVTNESDELYNYKYPHLITEGKIEYKKQDLYLPEEFEKIINKRFEWLDTYCLKAKKRKTRAIN